MRKLSLEEGSFKEDKETFLLSFGSLIFWSPVRTFISSSQGQTIKFLMWEMFG